MSHWLVVDIPVPETLRYEVVATLMELGAGGAEERAGRVVAYVPAGAVPERALRRVLRELDATLPELPEADVRWHVEDDADWTALWKEGLRARKVGDRIWTAPSWDVPDAGADDVVIVVDPAMAFGTGEHGTTRGCLRLLEGFVRPGDRALDVGTGTGILAVAMARLGAASVLAVDNDPDATDNAVETLERNDAADRVALELAAVDAAWLDARGPFDLVVANVLSGVLEPLLPAFARALERPGRLILSGILRTEADRMRAAAEAAGFTVDAEDREQEWWSARFRLD